VRHVRDLIETLAVPRLAHTGVRQIAERDARLRFGPADRRGLRRRQRTSGLIDRLAFLNLPVNGQVLLQVSVATLLARVDVSLTLATIRQSGVLDGGRTVVGEVALFLGTLRGRGDGTLLLI